MVVIRIDEVNVFEANQCSAFSFLGGVQGAPAQAKTGDALDHEWPDHELGGGGINLGS